jgi:hypothetical protein
MGNENRCHEAGFNFFNQQKINVRQKYTAVRHNFHFRMYLLITFD